jgi:hypothetical protein
VKEMAGKSGNLADNRGVLFDLRFADRNFKMIDVGRGIEV